MAKNKRVFEIAKELTVDSKAIIAKCAAEGVPGITTHMSPVKIGLEQTIREWFSSGQPTTAIETAAHVDLDKVRKPVRRRGKSGGQDDSAAGGSATTVAEPPETGAEQQAGTEGESGQDSDQAGSDSVVAAPAGPAAPSVTALAAPMAHVPVPPAASVAIAPASPAAVPAAESPKPAPVPQAGPARIAASAAPLGAPPAGGTATDQHQTAHRRPIHQGPPPTAAPQPPRAGPVAPPVTAPRPGHVPAPLQPAARASQTPPPAVVVPARPQGPMGKPNVPTRPKDVRPIGVALEKTPFKLQGPNVVRIEKPDVVQAPRSRRTGPGAAGGGTGQSEGTVPGISRSKGPTRGRGAGAPTEGEGEGEDRPKTAARRSTNMRRGRSAEALPTGPGKYSEQDLMELDARLNRASGFLKQRRRDLKKHEGGPGQAPSPAVDGGKVEVSEPITIKSLSLATGIKTAEIIKFLFKKGVMATINSAIDNALAQEVSMEYDIDLVVREQQTAEQKVVAEFENRAAIDMRPRPPVVTVMGHVDHGKTSLLDRIRKADVASHESGGITQHIGAYRVTVKGGDGKEKTVVFLDTPGHQAFTSMRARGAGITDLVVLVVAADDGVMPQTVESINHAKAAGVPIIVALNKIDKPEATEGNIRKIYGQLAEQGLNPTEWGGTTEVLKVSATSGQGVNELLEVLDYQAELLELQADYGGLARGTVIEAEMHPGRGSVARILVEQGMMHVGDFIVIGRAFGRVRDMTNERRQQVTDAGPATPLEISGLNTLPDAGDKFYVTDTLAKAEEISVHTREAERHKQLATQTKVTLENFADQLKAGTSKELRVILKADVQGSIKPIVDSLENLSTPEVSVEVLHAAVGGITEGDVVLAEASDAVIIGFHVVAPPVVRDLAEQKRVEIRTYRIIYEITDELKKAMEGMLEPEIKEEALGTAEVRQVYKITKVGNVAGCLVTDGVIQRNGKMRLLRDNAVVTEDRQIDSLKRIKEDAKEVRAGTECGIRLVGFDDIKIGDKLICYNTVSVRRRLG